MAATRKSDFTGDKFGDWEVVERAEADNGKRRWLVRNGEETRVVLQTELKDLVKRNDLGQRVHGANDPIHVSDPERNALSADDEIEHDGSAEDTDTEVGDLDAGLTAFAAPKYEPKGENAESAQIARAALGVGPDGLHPADDWTRKLDVEEPLWLPDESDVRPAELDPVKLAIVARQARETEALEAIDMTADEIVKHTGIGEKTPETVSEAGLDAAVPPQDPMRAAIRHTMSALCEVRDGIARLEAARVLLDQEITELQLAHAVTLEKLDEALKVAITR